MIADCRELVLGRAIRIRSSIRTPYVWSSRQADWQDDMVQHVFYLMPAYWLHDDVYIMSDCGLNIKTTTKIGLKILKY